MRTTRLTVTAVTAAALLAACAPTTPNSDVNGIGGSPTPNNIITVDPSTSDITDLPTDLPDNIPTITPPDVVEPPEEYDGDQPLNFPVTTGFTAEPVAGYSVEDITDATRYAMSFAQARFAMPGLWVEPARRSDPTAPTTYFSMTEYLNNKAQNTINDILLEPDTMLNNPLLRILAPQPPDGDYQWLTPAVADFTFGQPTYGEDNGDPIIAFTYTAQAVYLDGGSYFAIPVDGLLYVTVTETRDGWRVVSLEDSEQDVYGAPQPLENKPGNRFIPEE